MKKLLQDMWPVFGFAVIWWTWIAVAFSCEQQVSPPTFTPQQGAIYWTKPIPVFSQIADKYHIFIGPITDAIADTIFTANPNALLIDYMHTRYFHPWLTTLWTRYCLEHNIDPEQGYLHNRQRQRIFAPDSPPNWPWEVANLANPHFMTFIIKHCRKGTSPGHPVAQLQHRRIDCGSV
jgi:hypothetical protein